MSTELDRETVRELIARWAAGDQEAPSRLLPTCSEKAISILRRRGYLREDCRDLIQESLLRLHRWMQVGHPPPENLVLFLVVSARNVLRDRSCRKRLKIVGPVSENLPAPTEAISTKEEIPEMGRMLRAAIQQLPDRCRRVYELKLEGLKEREIACRLGLALGTVKFYLHDGMKRLRQYFGPTIRRMAA